METFFQKVSFIILNLSIYLFCNVFGQNNTAIFEFYSNTGEIGYQSTIGSNVNFDAPLRISKKINSSVLVSFIDSSTSKFFSIFPSIVKPGQSFVIVLRDKIQPIDSEYVNITIQGSQISNDFFKPIREEIKNLQIFFVDQQFNKKIQFATEPIRLNSTEFFINFNKLKCLVNETIASYKLKNSHNISFNNFMFELTGKYAPLFQFDAVEKINKEKFLELKYNNNCNDFELLANKTPIITLILSINPLYLTKNDLSTNLSSIYLFHLIQDNLNQSNHLLIDNIKFSKNLYEIEISEHQKKIEPIFRVQLIDLNNLSKSEVNLMQNFTFTIENNQTANSLILQTFKIHPNTGVINILNGKDITIEKYGNKINFNVNVFINDTLIDTTKVVIDIILNNKNELQSFRFEQTVYAFAVGPKIKKVGQIQATINNNILNKKSKVFYALSEGGASYFTINSETGEIYYNGPLEKNAKNYTIKAIAYNTILEIIDSTLVQILVAGIESNAPELNKKFDIIEIFDNTESNKIIYSVKAIDIDQDARLQFSILNISCLSILGEQINNDECKNLFYFGNNGLRNGSLIFNKLKLQKLNKLNIDQRLGYYVNEKTSAFSTVFVNISVTDINHLLEPIKYVTIVIRFIKNSTLTQTNTINNLKNDNDCKKSFNKNLIQKKIEIDESLPPNTFVYSVSLCPLSIIEAEEYENNFANNNFQMEKIQYSFENNSVENQYFKIDSQTGVIKTVGSLKNANSQTIKILAINQNNEKIIDEIILLIECKNSVIKAPEFQKKFYEFNIDRKDLFYLNGKPIGQIKAFIPNFNLLTYEIINLEAENNNELPFLIDDQGQIISIIDDKKIVVINEKPIIFNFFVKSIDKVNNSTAIVPVLIRILNNVEKLGPHLPKNLPKKAIIMENAPIGSFVTNLGIINSQQYSIIPSIISKNLNQTKNLENLVKALTIVSPTGIIQTVAPLSKLYGSGYLITIIAYGLHDTKQIELEIDVIPTSKCIPKFNNDQKLIYYVPENAKPGYNITKLIAEVESDCKLVYEFENTTDDSNVSNFLIDSNTGTITVNSNGIYTSEKKNFAEQRIQKFLLIAVAKSGNLFSRIGIEIRVNQNLSYLNKAPIFYDKNLTYRFYENVPVNTVVGRVMAYCNNEAFYYANPFVEYNFDNNLNNDKFAINSTTGEIFTRTMLDYDKDPFQTYNLNVIAICKDINNNGTNINNLISSYAAVQLELIDLNDNVPEFERDNYELSLEYTASINTIVGQILAYDNDYLTDRLYYYIENIIFKKGLLEQRLNNEYFYLNSATGEIRLKRSVIDLNNGYFVIEIKVYDNLKIENSKSSQTMVKIWICDSKNLVPVVFAENPIRLNSTKLDHYLNEIENAVPSVQLIIHDVRYRTIGMEMKVLRDFVIIRLLFINKTSMTYLSPSEVENFIHDLNLPDLKALDQQSANLLASNFDVGFNIVSNNIQKQMAIKKAENSIISSLLFTLFILSAILLPIFVLLSVILFYYYKKYIRKQKSETINNEKIHQSSFQTNTIKSKPMVAYQHPSAVYNLNSTNQPIKSQHYSSTPYITDENWENTSNYSDNNNNNQYYSTQEMKISLR